MKESEWKKFKVLKAQCLERFCHSILDYAQNICQANPDEAHEQYCQLYQYIHARDKEIGYAFDGLSRSKAELQILQMYRLNLYELSALDSFDPEIKASIKRLSEL